MNKVLIYDDDDRFKGMIRAIVEEPVSSLDLFKIYDPLLDTREFNRCLTVLENRQREFRKTGTWTGDRIAFDDAAVFVIDYDLFETRAFLRADYLAYLVRCFSTCGLIVGYRYNDDSFDLTLRGALDPFTDLYVGGQQLGNPGLWNEGGLTDKEYRPWYWPSLPDYLNRFRRKVKDVEQSITHHAPIHQVIGATSEIFARLPRSISEFLGGEPTETEFEHFVKNSGNGLEPKDAQKVNEESITTLARIGAARISKWLEWSVLPEQDIVVDAPHLVQRFPSLLAGDATEIESWNTTARLMEHEVLGIETELIEPSRLKEEHWFSRPVWFWDSLRECEDILEVREPWKFENPDWVFCEDTSRFHYREECREFVADVESPYKRRFVRYLEGTENGIEYRPRVRFVL